MLDRTIAYGLDFLFPARDDVIGASLALYGEFARPISDFLIDQATGGPGTLLDVGANIGTIGLPFAKARPDWRVLAIEAHRGVAAILAANALNNRLLNVQVVQAAAGAAGGVADFPNIGLDTEGNWGVLSLTTPTDERAPVLMVTLDDIAPADTRLVKIDIEGADADALRGAPRLLNQVRPIWLVEASTGHPEASREVIQILLDAGYAVHWFYAPFATADALKGRVPPDLGKGDANVVALPPGVANSWNLPVVKTPDDRRPAAASDYPYLQRYGLS